MKKKLLVLCVTAILISAFSTGCRDTNRDKNPKASGAPTETAVSNSSQVSISEEQAKDIALRDAGFRETDISGLRVHLDRSDDRPEYEVEFYYDNREYDYEIDAADGTITDKESDD